MKLELADYQRAYDTITSIIEPTPLVYNEWLSKAYDCQVYLKLENMLPIGSFKMRGAAYKISTLTSDEKKRGVLAVSAGNHAQGVAWAAKKFKVKATIVMPEGSPLTKIKNTEALGAKVILHGTSIEEAFSYAHTLEKKHKFTFIHPFQDKAVIAGQGTVGFELIEQCHKMDFVFSSIGGGGLVTGIGSVLKALKPNVKIYAGQSSGCSSMVESLKKNKLTTSGTGDTFADGIRVKVPSKEMFDHLKGVVDVAESVSDEKIAWAILQILEKARVIAEGAGAVPLALFDQVYKKNPKKFQDKNVVLVICGGNIDVNLLARIIDRGLIESHRKLRMMIPISDRPGSLHHLTGMVKNQGANILQVIHDRDSVKLGLSGTNVDLTVETRGEEHAVEFILKMQKEFPGLEVVG